MLGVLQLLIDTIAMEFEERRNLLIFDDVQFKKGFSFLFQFQEPILKRIILQQEED